MKDDADRLRSDVPVKFIGRDGEAVDFTGRSGIATANVAAGKISITIPVGCWARVRIEDAQARTITVDGGTTTRVTLYVLAMRRRFYAEGPLQWTDNPPWLRARTVNMRFTLRDRCGGGVAKGTSFDDLDFFTTGTMDLIRPTLDTSDANGQIEIGVVCRRAGEPTLFFGDRIDPKDRVDVFNLRALVDPDGQHCA